MKNVVKKALYGVSFGVLVGVIFLVLISALFGDGAFYTCSVGVVNVCGSELLATVVQFLLFALVGISFSLSSCVWKKENYPIWKKTVLCYILNLPVTMILAWFNTMDHYHMGVFLFHCLIYTVLFFNIWLFQYLFYKNKNKYMLDN